MNIYIIIYQQGYWLNVSVYYSKIQCIVLWSGKELYCNTILAKRMINFDKLKENLKPTSKLVNSEIGKSKTAQKGLAMYINGKLPSNSKTIADSFLPFLLQMSLLFIVSKYEHSCTCRLR